MNCGTCGMPTTNPQGICETCRKSKNRIQAKRQRKDEIIEKREERLEKEDSDDAQDVWFDEEDD